MSLKSVFKVHPKICLRIATQNSKRKFLETKLTATKELMSCLGIETHLLPEVLKDFDSELTTIGGAISDIQEHSRMSAQDVAGWIEIYVKKCEHLEPYLVPDGGIGWFFSHTVNCRKHPKGGLITPEELMYFGMFPNHMFLTYIVTKYLRRRVCVFEKE